MNSNPDEKRRIDIFLTKYRPHGPGYGHAQEKPDFDEHPDRAPLGIVGLPEPIRKLDAEIVFVTSRLLHFGHLMVSEDWAEVVNTSKCFLQSRQTYSWIGMVSLLICYNVL